MGRGMATQSRFQRNYSRAGPFARDMKERPVRLLAVVPAYNEVAAIGRVVSSLREQAPSFDVLVIDDGSTDDTAAHATAAGASVVKLPFNLGIGGAVQAGFVYAREHDYDYMAQVDGDGQHDPGELAKLLERISGEPAVDMVCGSRFITEDYVYPAPISRRTGIHLFAFALTRILGQRISDPTSGFRLYSRRAIALFARDYPHDYPEVEAILMVHAHRLRITEVPVRMHVRETGRSSITKPRSFYYMVKVSLALLAGLMRRRVVVDSGEPAPVSSQHG
jgi:glycosyltransferase involved in cell wall biosynthesis